MYKNTTRVEKLNSVLMSIFIILSLFNPMMIASAAAGETIAIGSSIVEPGDTFVLPITIANSAGVTGIDLDIFYDQNVVTVVSVLANNSISGSTITPSIDNTNGITSVAVTNTNYLNATSATPFVDVTFQAVSDGISVLDLQNIVLSDIDFNIYFPGTVNDGEIRVNGPPTLDSIGSKSISENSTLSFTLSASDPGLDTLTYSSVDLPTGSTLDSSSGLFTWTPTYDQSGSYPVQFNVSDETYSDSEIVTITVNDVNRAPALDSIGPKSVDENVALSFTLTASDADGDLLNYSAVDLPSGASLDVSSGLFTWTPTYDQSGIYSVQFNATDGTLNDSETVSITVNNVNRAPILNSISTVTINETETATIVLVASDPDGDSLTYSTNATFGDLSGNTFTWTSGFDDGGIHYLEFTANDFTLTNTQIGIIVVGNADRAPVLDLIGPKSVDENTALTFTLNASDPDNDDLTYSSVDLPSGASLDGSSGLFIWTPTYEQSGTYQVDFVVSGLILTDNETVTITVNNVNRAPVLDSIGPKSVNENAALTFTLTASDADGDSLNYSAVGLPTGATLDNSSGLFAWTPSYEQSGTYSLQFNATDGILNDSETVSITVDNVNRAPVAADDTDTTSEDTPITTAVLSNDSDIDGESLTVTGVTDPSNGTAVINSGANVTYTPDENFNGGDSYTYTISDSNGGTDTATVTITVSAVNDAPVATDDTSTTDEDTSVDITLSATDVDDDSLIYLIVGGASHGTVTLSGNTATYTPTTNYNGTDSFTFKTNDSTVDSNTATISITVSAVNDVPVATADTATTSEDTPVTTTVLSNDSDVDGDTLTVTAVTNPSNGTAVINDGTTVTYTPDENFNGGDSYTYTISDGNGGTATATATITVSSVNDVPVANADIDATSEDTPVTTTVLSNDSDADGDALTVTGVTDPSNGTVVINGDTTVTYIPNANFNGADIYTYTISDGNGGTDAATVTITVNAVNDAPVLNAISDVVINEMETATIVLTPSDPDGDSLTFSNSINMSVIATFNETTNTYTWVTTYDTVKYTNSETFTGMITVTDSGGLYDNQTVNIMVINKNRAPVLLPLSNITIKEGGTFTLYPKAVDQDKDSLTFVYLDIPPSFVGGDGTWKVNNSGDYTINVSVVDSSGLYDNQSVTINVTGLPPKLFVVNPVDGAELNSGDFKVSGIAYDENLVSLTLLLNDTLSIDLTANVSDIANGGGWFEQNITLYEGINTLEFNASDASLSTVVTRTVVVNTTKPNSAPILTITGPLNDSQITSESNVTTVSGYVTDDSGIPEVLVSIGSMDKIVGVSKDGNFGANVYLTEGQNTITVTATDASGDTDTETLVVNYTKIIPVDTVDPILILTYPPKGLEVGSEKLLVTGYATDDVGIKNVTVDDVEVTLLNGVFSKEVTLIGGNNTITVIATDTSDNSVTRTRIVMYDIPDPKDGLIKVEKISLSVSQNSLYAGSGNISNVTAFATDIAGRLANDSEIVKFVTVTNNGATQIDVQIENGTAVLSVIATEEPQTIIVIASNDTMVLASTQVVVKPNIEIKETMDNISITVGGRTAGKSGVVLLDGLVNIQTDPSVAAELVNASEDDEVTLTVDVGTGSNLEIKMENAMLTDGGNLTGEVSGIILKNRPIKTDFTDINETVGEVTIDVNVEFNGNTVPGTLTFEMSVHKSIDDLVSSIGGEDAGGVDADTIKDSIAKKLKDVYKKNADKTHVDNGVAAVIHAKLDGASNDDVSEVPITMTLSLDWFNNVAGGIEDNVKVFEINETTGEIEDTLDCVVVNNGDGTVTISATASGFSSYAFTSTTTAPDIESSNDDVPSSSSGGGGGSGSSGEAFENIEVKDVIREYIAIDSAATYEFIEDANAIGFVTFDAKTNAGYITATVEVLKDTSALVSAAPSGEVYQNMNIWIGKSGYATETNIANPVIGFKVAKSWITENDIDKSTINLNRYSSGAWNKLPTTKTDEDASYIYFSSETPGFSPFAITGDERSSAAVANVPDSSSTASTTEDYGVNEPVGETTNVQDDEDKSSGGFALVIGLIGMSVLGVGMYLRKDEIGKWINQRR